ncbi:TetR/AcrR family transcriptional regulator [Rhodococcus spelaei]|uniref:TetR/AcrR family transcriptional regulator n=1 Tax=Rhodococcus spelaei TaxID=2546320 RepID=A0A541B8J7_9NOCA|nr:TetR/AcrR family transcriptional regulator [Rhodococcus spelaei]TQF68647.1 TetR/AcrR family transcriptional regulator [Rhodococcus spelaei]
MSPRRAAAVPGDASLREHLIAAAERLIARRGTAGVTVRDIAREAEVADGVLYNHFANKEELLALGLGAHVRAVEAGLVGAVPTAGAGVVAENLRTLVRRGFALHRAILPAFAGALAQPKVLSAYASGEGDVPSLRVVLADYLRGERELGRVDRGADVDAAVAMISGAWHDLVLRGLLRGEQPLPEEPGDEQVGALVTTVLRGIGPR